jgi:hypothetical protein
MKKNASSVEEEIKNLVCKSKLQKLTNWCNKETVFLKESGMKIDSCNYRRHIADKIKDL